MAYLAKAKKVDLLELANELGCSVTDEARVVDLKDIITKSETYDEEFTKELLSRITDDRIASENAAKELADRQFELAKLKIENGIQNVNISNENDDNRQIKNVHVDFRDLMHKYNIKDGDINFYLVLFERQARRAGLSKENYVSQLLGLLPYEITQLIAREDEENANNYDYVKSLLLKRYKLSADKFRSKFLNHVRNSQGTWKDFSFELKNYFQEWLSGLNISDFDSLFNLIVTEQLKKHVNATTREHFVDQWPKFNNPDELADKLDNYDSVRSNNSSKNRNVPHYPRIDKLQEESKQTTFHEKKNREQGKIVNSNIRNEKGEFKCFRCNNYGHISRDCLKPRILFCKKCNKEGHSQRTCKLNSSEKRENNNLTVSQDDSVSSTAMAPTNYLKDTYIYGYKVKALIDTGSSSCLLRESIALKLNLDIQPDNSELFGFGNKSKPVTRAIGKAVVNIRVDDVVGKRITLLIVKDESQPYDLILGRTFIDLPYIAFARIDGNLKFGYANSDVFSKIQVDMRENMVKLETADEVEIKSNSINLIKAKMVEGENAINNEVNLVESIGQNFYSIPEIVNSKTIVPVINKGNFNFKIRKNQCLGRGVENNEECSLPNLSNNKQNKAEETIDEQVLMMQHSDHDLRKIIEVFKKKDDERSKEEKQMIEGYVFKQNKIYRKFKTKDKEILLYVIPKSMRKSIVVKFHDLMGHFSVDRTVSKILELYWFASMKRYVRRHISMCFECLLNKIPGGRQQGLLNPIAPGKRPFSIIHVDHLGPFVRTGRGNKELFIIIDNLTRFVRIVAVKNTSTKNVLKALQNFINEFGLPDRLISDRGSCFTSKQFEEFCTTNGIQHTLNSTKHPKGNGMVERCNRTILSTISTDMEDPQHKDWDLKVKDAERNLNNAVNKTTNKTPFQMLHGYLPRFYDGLISKLADDSAKEWIDPKEVREDAKEMIEAKQKKMKAYYDKRKCTTVKYDKGELVVMRKTPQATGQPLKTHPKYRGPLTITEVLPGDTYRVAQLEEKQKGHFFTTTAHVSQLKPWRIYPDSDDSSETEY